MIKMIFVTLLFVIGSVYAMDGNKKSEILLRQAVAAYTKFEQALNKEKDKEGDKAQRLKTYLECFPSDAQQKISILNSIRETLKARYAPENSARFAEHKEHWLQHRHSMKFNWKGNELTSSSLEKASLYAFILHHHITPDMYEHHDLLSEIFGKTDTIYQPQAAIQFLEYACQVHTITIVEPLLKFFVDKSSPIPMKVWLDQATINLVACENITDEHKAELVRLLKKYGATLNRALVDDQDTPLHLACKQGCVKTVCALLDEGVDINDIGEYAERPLHRAVQGHYPEIVHILIERGVFINEGDEDGKTALHHALLESEAKEGIMAAIVGLLIDRGYADINRCDDDGISPLALAYAMQVKNPQNNDYQHVIALLEARGGVKIGDLNLIDTNGQSDSNTPF